MHRLLIPVRAEMTAHAFERAIGSGERPDGLHVVILNVQPKPVEWQTRGLFRETIRSHLIARGYAACKPVEARLAAVGISFHTRVELGDECAEILRCAAEEHCDEILLQADRLSTSQRAVLWLTGWVAGSTAGQVIHSIDLPVTVVH